MQCSIAAYAAYAISMYIATYAAHQAASAAAFPFCAAFTFSSYDAFALRQVWMLHIFVKSQKYTHFAHCYSAYGANGYKSWQWSHPGAAGIVKIF